MASEMFLVATDRFLGSPLKVMVAFLKITKRLHRETNTYLISRVWEVAQSATWLMYQVLNLWEHGVLGWDLNGHLDIDLTS
jgi:hypothetical protein